MKKPTIPRDDVLDVEEMTIKLERYISRVFNENETRLGMSALMSATINCTLEQCDTLEEVMLYRNFFVKIFDSSIRAIKIRQQK